MIFVLDTNALWQVKKLETLANLARRNNHRVQIPALAFAEHMAQRRRQIRENGKSFDTAMIDAFVQRLNLEIVSFDQPVAERCAKVLAEEYPAKTDWHAARRDRCARRFRVEQIDTGEACPATVDWYIAASYREDGFVLVTHDQGAEFRGVRTESMDSAIALAGSA